MPTAPEAADTTSVSPDCGLPTLLRPKYAVLPGIPSVPKKEDKPILDSGTFSKAGSVSFAFI